MSQCTVPTLGEDGLILEGIATTLNPEGTVNIAPMGPIVAPELNCLLLRPFKSSTTYANLVRHGQGVFHVTDDVLLFAQSAIGNTAPQPRLTHAAVIEGQVIVDSCRWCEFKIESVDDSQQRAAIVARTVKVVRNRDFVGFNRAQHAVLEAAILATRMHLVPASDIEAEFGRLRTVVEKTGSNREHAAFELLAEHVETSRVASGLGQ